MAVNQDKFEVFMRELGVEVNNPMQLMDYDGAQAIKTAAIEKLKAMGPAAVRELGVSLSTIDMMLERHIGLIPKAATIEDILDLDTLIVPESHGRPIGAIDAYLHGHLFISLRDEKNHYKGVYCKLAKGAVKLIEPNVVHESVFLEVSEVQRDDVEPFANIRLLYNSIIGGRVLARIKPEGLTPLLERIAELSGEPATNKPKSSPKKP